MPNSIKYGSSLPSPIDQTAKAMHPAIGQIISVAFEQVTVACEVIDAKNAYGKLRLMVRPCQGTGYQWVELSRVRIQ